MLQKLIIWLVSHLTATVIVPMSEQELAVFISDPKNMGQKPLRVIVTMAKDKPVLLVMK